MNQDILLKQKIGLRLSRAGHLSKLFAIQTFKKSEPDLRPEQFTVLYTLKEHNGMYLRQLGDITYKDRPNMTRICSILEDKGYYVRLFTENPDELDNLYKMEEFEDTNLTPMMTVFCNERNYKMDKRRSK